MKRFSIPLASLLVMFMFLANESYAQKPTWIVGGRIGMSIASGGGGSEAGFQIGPTGEVIFNRNYAIVEALNINTQTGTTIEWSNYFKYYFLVHGSTIKPYIDGGFSLWFVTGGPYFALDFGGGVMFEIQHNLYVPMDFQFGPIFVTGNTVFGVEITTGLRYEFN